MRFFKYLFALFISLFALNVQADYWKYQTYTSSSAMSLCTSLVSLTQFPPGTSFSHADIYINPATPHNATCYHYNKSNTITQLYTLTLVKEACPRDQEEVFDWWTDLPLPSTVCLRKCEYERPVDKGVGCVDLDIPDPISGSPKGIASCGKYVSNGKECNQPDPDPNTQPKPPLRPDECKNSTGSDSYCDKPPDRGCPSGYKQAMFNNKQICVKDSPTDPNPNDPNNGPDDPDGPDDPNNPPNPNGCNNGDPYCDKPPDDSCPTGYYQARYQGKDICVKNNPNNNGPNPNDPNNPPDGNGDGDNGGGDGGIFCEKSGKALCDAVTAIKDFFTDETEDDSKDELPTRVLDQQEFDTQIIKVNAAYCPADSVLNMNTPAGQFSKTFSYQEFCNKTAWFGYLILAAAYLFAAHIVVRA